LGKQSLGNNFVCGNTYDEDEIYFVFAIGDLKKSVAQDYLEGGKYYKTIETFYRFFMPANASIKTEILLSKQKKQMYIGSMEEATLGIATVI
jgi:predicted component of type VI protein secretion system